MMTEQTLSATEDASARHYLKRLGTCLLSPFQHSFDGLTLFHILERFGIVLPIVHLDDLVNRELSLRMLFDEIWNELEQISIAVDRRKHMSYLLGQAVTLTASNILPSHDQMTKDVDRNSNAWSRCADSCSFAART